MTTTADRYQLPPGAQLYFPGDFDRRGSTGGAAGIQPAVVGLVLTAPVTLAGLGALALWLAGPIGLASYALAICLIGLGCAIAGARSTLGKVAVAVAVVAVLVSGYALVVTVSVSNSISDCFSDEGC